VRYRFPNIIQKCQQWGIDVFQEPIPVAPAAHYWMGGVAVDLMAKTSVPGLYAIGETASTGVHGANRLASNSLLECIVFAAELQKLELESVAQAPLETPRTETLDWTEDQGFIESIRQQLPALMWHSAGISRQQSILEEAIATVSAWRAEVLESAIGQYLQKLSPDDNLKFSSEQSATQLKLAAETLNLLDIGYWILKSAAFRTESRGGHYRSDYPQPLDHWQVHTLIQGNQVYSG
jgi:L-aspartate oxidase